MTDQIALTAAAARRRTFAATMAKGASGSAHPTDDLQDNSTKQSGVVASLDNINRVRKSKSKVKKPRYGAHAAALAQSAHENGKPALASAIAAVAHAPHPQDKMQVAQNYLATLPPEEAQQHAHMFTKQLMKQSD
ncbi:hypothetical protein [Asaia prunellae]|uniref:hypothetical protein n=1 Tax=Asaia prunellae TaxID=610245 RepID=UPI0004712B92|nr:hypothetical protein [Asaia prunellae]